MKNYHKRGERFAIWIADHLPRFVLENPERVLINVACSLIGLSAFFHQTGSVPTGWPPWLQYSWGGVMIAGSAISVYGARTLNRAADRFGALVVATACFFYGYNIVGQYGNGRLITGLIFFGITVAKLVRFVRSAAVQARVSQYIREESDRQVEEQ